MYGMFLIIKYAQVSKICQFRFACYIQQKLEQNSRQFTSLFRSTGRRSTKLQVRCDSCFNRVKIDRERDVRGHQMRFAFTIANCGKYSKRHDHELSQYDDRCDSSAAYFHNGRRARKHNYSPRTNGPISRVFHRVELIRPGYFAVTCFDELARITRV